MSHQESKLSNDPAAWTALCSTLKAVHPTLEAAYDLVQAFLAMVHDRTEEKLDAWLDQIRASQLPELIRFGKGIERDKSPVQAALQLPHSNGVVEGMCTG